MEKVQPFSRGSVPLECRVVKTRERCHMYTSCATYHCCSNNHLFLADKDDVICSIYNVLIV